MAIVLDEQRRTSEHVQGRRLGVYGGTFDPIHIAHLIVADEVRAQLNLDAVHFVPARSSPFKRGDSFFSDTERLAMVALATDGDPHFVTSRVDMDRDPPSYTVDTLREIDAQSGTDSELFFIMGWDSLAHFHQWYRPDEIVCLANIVAVTRPGEEADLQLVERAVPGLVDVLYIVDTLQLAISSTDIRKRIRCGLPFRYHVPPRVAEYIERIRDGKEQAGS